MTLALRLLAIVMMIAAGLAHAEDRRSIVTTTGMIADLVHNIVGEEAKVTALMGPGVDPHLYKATHGDLERLTGADVVFYNGLHLEGKMADVLEKLSKRLPCFAVASAIPEDKLRRPPEFEGLYDPHIWFDVSLWVHAAEKVRDELGRLWPERKEMIDGNAARHISELEQLHDWVKQEISSIPDSQRILITAHDAFGYFGRAYGIEVMGLQGISTATEFGLNDITRLVDIVVGRKVKAIFVESSVPQKFVSAVVDGVAAKHGKVVIGGELYSDAMGPEGTPEGTYVGMVTHNVQTITNALE